MRLVPVQLAAALTVALFIPKAPAQCCQQTCPRPGVYQNQNRPGPPVIARGTRQESKSSGTVSWNVAGAKPVRYDGMDLKIISGTPQRRLATVNDQTFLAGETLKVAVRGDSVRVHCVEIRERSVLVTVQGEAGPRELKLQAWH